LDSADPAILVRCVPVNLAPLSQTRLAICKAARPDGLPDRLFPVTRPVSTPMIKAGLAVRRANPHIFQTGLTHHGARGMRHRMVLAGAAAPPCGLAEWLEKETTLQDLILPSARDRLART